jgi:hypothetical protein
MLAASKRKAYQKNLAVCQRCGAYFSIDGRGRVPNWCKTCKPIHYNAMNYLRRSGNKESV